jgi:hypothetical protein
MIRQQAEFEQLADADTETLLEKSSLQQPWWFSLMGNSPASSEPASESELADLEQRLKFTLDPDLREVLLQHNGVPILNLAASDQFSALDHDRVQAMFQYDGSDDHTWPGGKPLRTTDAAALRSCIVISEARRAPLLQCPHGHVYFGIVDTQSRTHFASFKSYLRAQAARMQSMR